MLGPPWGADKRGAGGREKAWEEGKLSPLGFNLQAVY